MVALRVSPLNSGSHTPVFKISLVFGEHGCHVSERFARACALPQGRLLHAGPRSNPNMPGARRTRREYCSRSSPGIAAPAQSARATPRHAPTAGHKAEKARSQCRHAVFCASLLPSSATSCTCAMPQNCLARSRGPRRMGQLALELLRRAPYCLNIVSVAGELLGCCLVDFPCARPSDAGRQQEKTHAELSGTSRQILHVSQRRAGCRRKRSSRAAGCVPHQVRCPRAHRRRPVRDTRAVRFLSRRTFLYDVDHGVGPGGSVARRAERGMRWLTLD